MDNDHLFAGAYAAGVVGAVAVPGPVKVPGSEDQAPVTEVHMGPRRRNELPTVMGIDSVTHPSDRIRRCKPVEDVDVTQYRCHPDIVAH